jgi:hypothetical protein
VTSAIQDSPVRNGAGRRAKRRGPLPSEEAFRDPQISAKEAPMKRHSKISRLAVLIAMLALGSMAVRPGAFWA